MWAGLPSRMSQPDKIDQVPTDDRTQAVPVRHTVRHSSVWHQEASGLDQSRALERPSAQLPYFLGVQVGDFI